MFIYSGLGKLFLVLIFLFQEQLVRNKHSAILQWSSKVIRLLLTLAF